MSLAHWHRSGHRSYVEGRPFSTGSTLSDEDAFSRLARLPVPRTLPSYRRISPGVFRAAQHRADSGRRHGLWRSGCVQRQLEGTDAASRPAHRRGDALHRRPHAVVGMHTDALRTADRALRLALAPPKWCALWLRSQPDRARPDDAGIAPQRSASPTSSLPSPPS